LNMTYCPLNMPCYLLNMDCCIMNMAHPHSHLHKRCVSTNFLRATETLRKPQAV
jgi:hypothetical protein